MSGAAPGQGRGGIEVRNFSQLSAFFFAQLFSACPLCVLVGAVWQGFPLIRKRIFPNIYESELDLLIPNNRTFFYSESVGNPAFAFVNKWIAEKLRKIA